MLLKQVTEGDTDVRDEDRLLKQGMFAACVCSLLILVGGCPIGGPTLVFVEGDSGSTASLAVGKTLAVVLSGNASTGYEWEVAELDTAVLANTGTSYVSDCVIPLDGCGETGTYMFTALSTGITTLRMIYHRPWEDEEPARTFELAVTVTD